jgi:type II secretory pathway pseudopilin PulG
VTNQNQWTGRRSLSDHEIKTLAEKLVEEVRKRGPFLSLADFINRRVGDDEALARAGALQSAIDTAKINKGYDSRPAAASATLAFPAAENQSPAAQGAPGIVKQADLLTPIAPVLSARSDSFMIRGYGEKLDGSGTKVLARAWCEAVVERDRGFVDSSDPPETATATLNPVNRKFGRRFVIRSFRWLHPNEI